MVMTQGTTMPMFAADSEYYEMLNVARDLKWSQPVRIEGVAGCYWVQKALTTKVFWKNYNDDRRRWNNLGFVVQKQNRKWVVVRTHLTRPVFDPEVQKVFDSEERFAGLAVSTILQMVDLEKYAVIPGVDRKSLADSVRTDAQVCIPAPSGCEYLPYQKAGIEIASNRLTGTLIADEMGLGKTIQALGVVNNVPDILQVLVVCPASVKINWAREAGKWLVNQRDIYMLGSKKPWDIPVEGPVFVIINYDQLRNYSSGLKSRVWDLVILDEAHYIKNLGAKRTTEIIGSLPLATPVRRNGRVYSKPIVKPIPSKRKLALTGTPITRNVQNLWPIVSWLNPEYWGKPRDNRSYRAYMDRYTEPIESRMRNGAEVIVGYESKNLAELQQKLRSSVMIRRRKDDVLKDLPSKMRRTIILELLHNEEKAVVAEETTLVNSIVGAYLRDVAVNFEDMAEIRKSMSLVKAPRVADYLLEALEESSSIVYFGHHRDAIDLVAQKLKAKKVKVGIYTGATPEKKRQQIIDDFQSGKITIFLGSMEAAGTGITLTRASRVVFGELNWSAAVMAQAEDRTHRIGQKNSVLIEHIVLDGSIDVKLSRTIRSKIRTMEKGLGISRSSDISQTQVGVDDDFDIAIEWLLETKSDDRKK